MRAKVDHVTDCVFLPAHERDTHRFCDGLAGRRKLSLWREFSSASSQHLPRCRWGGAVAVLADGLDGKIKKGDPLFFLSHQIQRPLQCIVLPPGTLRGVCPRLWSRGPAAAEAPRRVRSRGSHIDLADGLEMGSPFFHLYSPGLALCRGGSLSCSSSPVSESALICSSFSPRRFICFVPSGSRVAEAYMPI